MEVGKGFLQDAQTPTPRRGKKKRWGGGQDKRRRVGTRVQPHFLLTKTGPKFNTFFSDITGISTEEGFYLCCTHQPSLPTDCQLPSELTSPSTRSSSSRGGTTSASYLSNVRLSLLLGLPSHLSSLLNLGITIVSSIYSNESHCSLLKNPN